MGLNLSISSYTSITETTANIQYSASLDINISGLTITKVSGYIGNKSYSNWENSNVWVTGLQAGSSQTIQGSITYEYSYEQITGYDENNNPIKETKYGEETYTDSITVYTHPGPWHWSDYISQNDIIEEKLTYSLINKWVDHLSEWKSWSAQADWYSAYDNYYNNNTGEGYKVHSKDIIYLQWFNNCANAHPRASTISHNNNKDIISVDRFSTLDFNGTS